MSTVAVFLIYFAVAIRSLASMEGFHYEDRLLSLLVPYGLLLGMESWLGRRLSSGQALRPGSGQALRPGSGQALRPSSGQALRPGSGQALRLSSWQAWVGAAYLLIQIGLVTELLLVPPNQDTFLALFIPLSLTAVLFFGRRIGFLWIGAFSLGMIRFLIAEPESNDFVMAVFFEAVCFGVGSYAHLIQKAENARRENQRMALELQDAHQELQEYASQVEELASEQERYRLARALHDSVTQTVFSMNLSAQTARLLLERDPGRVSAQLDRMLELARSAMSQIQKLVLQLQSRLMVEGELIAALTRLVEERRRQDSLDVRLEVCGERDLTERVTDGLLGIVQEALTNVVKHARTPQATVRVNLGGGTMSKPACVEIEDQGAGFDPQMAVNQPGHLGLAEIAERAAEIGWRVSIESQPGQGTRIRLEENAQEG